MKRLTKETKLRCILSFRMKGESAQIKQSTLLLFVINIKPQSSKQTYRMITFPVKTI